jgi:hypothetical protein
MIIATVKVDGIIKRFSALILSDDYGAVIREAALPQ